MQFLFALIFFILGLGANASTFNDIIGSLPDGGYMADMKSVHAGLLNITNLDGTPVKGSPFEIDITSVSAPVIHDPKSKQTWDQWGCIDETGDYGFWQVAGHKLGTWCNEIQMAGDQMRWWQTEQELAYICNYAGEQSCSGHEWFDYMENTIEPGCHGNGAGWFLQGSGDKTYGRGIKVGRSDPLTVCSNA
ncbi:hypothetical protein PG993_002858 [Apiospora rasikravindrae]|uniref:Uncharacterized protein n=1 Tax=Apiospora rasikravindrae TaxID=990691 RepID=A0ABR1TY20_9PEZI